MKICHNTPQKEWRSGFFFCMYRRSDVRKRVCAHVLRMSEHDHDVCARYFFRVTTLMIMMMVVMIYGERQ